jgi:hypothetical protein
MEKANDNLEAANSVVELLLSAVQESIEEESSEE